MHSTTETSMGRNRRGNERQRMAHFAALLFSFANIAEGTAQRGFITRCILLMILRVAENLGRVYVQRLDARALCLPEHIMSDDPGSPTEAVQLAWLLRMLGTILATFLAWLDNARNQTMATKIAHDICPRNGTTIPNACSQHMPARASPGIKVASTQSLVRDAFHQRAATRQLFLKPLETAVEVVDAVDDRVAFGG